MNPSRTTVADAAAFAGGALVAVGTALVYLPAGLIVAGLMLAAWALLVFDVKPSDR